MNPSYEQIRARVDVAAQATGHAVNLLAVSKMQPVAAIRELAMQGQRAFGENYVQEAIVKQRELADLDLEWHLIGPLQSNKCREAALHFDWLQSLDREKLIEPLNRFRPADRPPLNVLIQVNIDSEASKSGCAPDAIPALAAAIASAPRLRLRGLMAIPEPADADARGAAFTRMRERFDALRADLPGIDTLSMGMSDDFELAIATGATLVRIGTALFGTRNNTR
ncbi:MAG: YggS family pyridoxal phosphate-dependent enzyme [Xanthomonadaceae bacterium]|nr:YggS family pyridoxal phosphate-dependent enzyme [Xanthomonadaceae bacterium]MDE1885642.1 YggS family pyridoxal phosphate-dependent enzyme [Xanthomonadaceae bacterium]MDE1961665.1 YggS family pyridoxal phosphate-dependent enzyme [Xanthomonadaceae bacterium]MDE2085395.1 YggS family pyridoxal phosphate-dependent enzyme [Xanthomonadaceae bacterium]MDE2257716.1 YggS family pyridoxal phosphate-dependent enzyme [Xanthomonadaceae bacterium]